MNISKKVDHYLRDANVDFATFFILDIVVRDKDKAVVILVPRYPEKDHYFSVRYRGERYGYQDFDRMMTILVESKLISRFTAKRLTAKYNHILRRNTK